MREHLAHIRIAPFKTLIADNVCLTDKQISDERREAARGAELLLSATLLHQYCTDDGEADNVDDDNSEALEVPSSVNCRFHVCSRHH